MTELSFQAGADEAGERLDAVLARRSGLSRTQATRLIADGLVEVGGTPASKSTRLEEGATVRASLPGAAAEPEPEDVEIPIVFEDRWLLVVSKPAGLVVHPAPGHRGGTLVNALLARDEKPAGGDPDRPGIVHRLDAGTSGLMVVAKDEQVHAALVEAMAARQVTRVYQALVEGVVDTDTLTIDAPIGRSPRQRKQMAVVASGKPARTEVTVLERFESTTLIEARPITGRTHQIRVHMTAAGYPIVGDAVYGKQATAREVGLERPFLHAWKLSFTHPVGAEPMSFTDPLPPDLVGALERLAPG